MKDKFKAIIGFLIVAAMAWETPAQAPNNSKEVFDNLCAKVQQKPESVSEQEILQVLDMGKELGRPYAASLAIKRYTSEKLELPPALLKKSIENALLVGDERTALARYKAYLKSAQPGQEASDMAATLYTILIDFLDAKDDAYRFMSEEGEKFRQSINVRKFDTWYVSESQCRQDYAGLAKRLSLVFTDQNPLEEERFYFWDKLDWLMNELGTKLSQEKFEAVSHCRKLVSLIRGDERRKAKYDFYVANLAFKAGSTGKEKVALEQEFASVVAAATAYLNKYPTADTLKDILTVFSEGGWDYQVDSKRNFFVVSFDKLSDKDREAMLKWHKHIATREQWAALGIKYPELFRRSEATSEIPFVLTTDKPDLYKQQAQFLQGVWSREAAIINSLAAGADLNDCVDHLVQKESWHLDEYPEVYELLDRYIWPGYKSFPRDEQHKLPDDYYGKVVLRFGTQYVAKTPIAFDTEAARNYMVYVWRHSGTNANDKSKVAVELTSLDWVPYTEKERKTVFIDAYNEFKRWTDSLRLNHEPLEKQKQQASDAVETTKKELEKINNALAETKQKAAQINQAKATADPKDAKKLEELTKQLNDLNGKVQELTKKSQELTNTSNEQTKKLAEASGKVDDSQTVLARVSPLEEAFKKALDVNTGDPNKAPNELCKNMALALVAARENNNAAFMEAARTAYPLVKDYDIKKTPMGRKILRFLVSPSQDMDTFDSQCEVLADQLSRWNPQGPNRQVAEMANAIMRSRKLWDWWRIPKDDQEKARKLNSVFAKTMNDQLDKGQFSSTLFDWFRATRHGEGWHDHPLNQDVLGKMIEGKTLEKTSWRQNYQLATPVYMWLVRDEFQNLSKKYSPGEYFDDRFIEEVLQNRYLDIGYWRQGGTDKNRKVRDLAAKIMEDYVSLPSGYGEEQVVLSSGYFWEWQNYAMDADVAIRNTMLDKIESYYGKTRFDTYAMGRPYFRYRASLQAPEGRKEFFAKLSTYLDRVQQALDRPGLPYMGQLTQIEPTSITDEELRVLLRMFSPSCVPWRWSPEYYHETLAFLLHKALLEKGRENELFAVIPHFWKIARDTGDGNFQHTLAGFAQELLEAEKYELAAVYSGEGLDILGTGLPDGLRTSLTSVRSRSITNVGGVIPVNRGDPKYPLFAAQLDYFNGNVQGAWQNYLIGNKILLQVFKELDPTFCTWLINRNIEVENFELAEALARAMMQWMDSAAVRFSPEMRVQVLLSYANIAFHRPEYPKARALYGSIAAAKEFEGLRGQIDAELKIAEVDRLSGQPDEAIKRLEKLLREKDRYTQTEANYHLALVKKDMEEYLEANEHLQLVFALDSTHADARILEGKINLQIKHLEQASRIDKIGLSAEQEYIVPGKVLRVGIVDRTLAVVGTTSAIEIRAWTDSGDEEYFNLMPFADSKTRFEGEIRTELAPAKKADRILQLLGKDKAHYDFSEQFKKSHKVTVRVDHTLSVVSDSELTASSGKILSKEEQEELALEEMVRARLRSQRREGVEDKGITLSAHRPGTQIKPGNKINVRVVDSDRSVTAQKDNVTIIVATSSGDKISSFTLEETDTHSGVFEGVVPTESAPAIAYATDSDEGREPNFVISSGNYPAWVALPDNKRPKVFSVDLNDNEFLAKMKIEAAVAGRKLKDFLVQVSPNGKDFETVGSWPTACKSWDGSLTATVMKHLETGRPTKSCSEAVARFEQDMENASLQKKHTINIKTLATSWSDNIFGHADALKLSWDPNSEDTWYLARFSGAFHLPKRQTRTFKLQPKATNYKASYYLAIDGKVGASRDASGRMCETPCEYAGILAKGLHRIDVFVQAQRRADPGFEVLTDSDEPPYLAACPADMFDPEKHPEILAGIYKEPATVTANEDGTSFDIAFTEGTRARAVRFCINDFETDAPAINKIRLETGDGQVLLPTKTDLLALKRNQVLEVVPGDQISISYEDPTCISENMRVQEAFLSVTYANATLSPCLISGYIIDNTGMRQPKYVAMRRFRSGDTVSVLITDPDGDVSGASDILKLTVRTYDTKPVELKALETEKHSGEFVARIFPVAGEPKRTSEVQVKEGDDLILAYIDQENTDPGVPWIRTATIEQSWYQKPDVRVYNVTSEPLSDREIQAAELAGSVVVGEQIPMTRNLLATRPTNTEPETASAILGAPLFVELLWPTIAQSLESKATIYVQTSSGRKAHGTETNDEFDINVPGTIKVECQLGKSQSRMMLSPWYKDCVVRGDRYAGEPLDDGRFTFVVPTQLAELPKESLVNKEMDEEALALSVNGKDDIFVGFEYTNDTGKATWITRKVELSADTFFDTMDRRYQEKINGVYVGESVYFRVIDMKKDLSNDRDKITIQLASTSGEKKDIELTETFNHSGIFKGLVKFVYAAEEITGEDGSALPVKHGEMVTSTYDQGKGKELTKCSIEVFKGSDGVVLPFSKRFKDPSIAVRTQLAVAEAYFELAKEHRRLGQEDMAQQEIVTGKKLLDETLRDYPDTEWQAQADYLLANLALEFAEESKKTDVKKEYYNEAISRFSTITATYQDSSYAPKAQYKKALALEKMGNFDAACEEYVKLSYRWPDNELIAETIARLGQYFLRKGKTFQDEADKQQDPVEQEKAKIESRNMFKTAAEVFSRLAVRFPTHKLADETTALSAQCYMKAEEFDKAIELFMCVIEKPEADKNVKPEAMYWCGDCYMRVVDKQGYVNAYRMFKNLTWNYPETKWAKYARGRLTDRAFAEIEE